MASLSVYLGYDPNANSFRNRQCDYLLSVAVSAARATSGGGGGDPSLRNGGASRDGGRPASLGATPAPLSRSPRPVLRVAASPVGRRPTHRLSVPVRARGGMPCVCLSAPVRRRRPARFCGGGWLLPFSLSVSLLPLPRRRRVAGARARALRCGCGAAPCPCLPRHRRGGAGRGGATRGGQYKTAAVGGWPPPTQGRQRPVLLAHPSRRPDVLELVHPLEGHNAHLLLLFQETPSAFFASPAC